MVSEFHDGGGIAQVVDAMEQEGGRADQHGGDRARHRRAGLPRQRRHHRDLSTSSTPTSPASRAIRPCSTIISECAPKTQIVHRRRAADPRRRAGRHLRLDVRRCVHRRRDPDPSADARGAGDLFPQAQAERRRRDARVEPQSRACRRWWPASPRRNGAIMRVYDGGDIEEDDDEHRWIPTDRGDRAQRGGFRRAGQVGALADPRSAIRASGSGPTTIPTSSAHSSASCARGSPAADDE